MIEIDERIRTEKEAVLFQALASSNWGKPRNSEVSRPDQDSNRIPPECKS